ncbi:MAG: glutathione S-transferase [Pseudomonadota bacterium]
MTLPILYSFRRCPYAMRARLAIADAGKQVELREIVLRDKAPEFLEASPKGTVPVLVLPDGRVIEESLEVMDWALDVLLADQRAMIEQSDRDFKPWLDRYKYPTRYEGGDGMEARTKASVFLRMLDDRLADQKFLFGNTRTPADFGIAPFVRQFAHVDLGWFKAQDWVHLIGWYEDFVDWDGFQSVMLKYPKWAVGIEPIFFPEV